MLPPSSHSEKWKKTRSTKLNENDHEHNHLSIMLFLRSIVLIIIIITTSPLVLFAQSDTSLDFLTKSEPKDEAKLTKTLEKIGSSEAGLFYSTWGTGLHER